MITFKSVVIYVAIKALVGLAAIAFFIALNMAVHEH
jgi:hypothetical protein